MTSHVPILAYHSILPGKGAPLPTGWAPGDTISFDSFCAQLDLLKAAGWRSAVARRLNDSTLWNSFVQQVLFTFDDGHASDLLAAGALAARGFTGTFYIPWSNVGRAHFLDSGDIRRLCRDGFGIGSHGLTHTRLTAISDQALWREMSESKERLENLIGEPVTDFAVPFGSYDQRVIDAARRAGYTTVMSSDFKLATPDPKNGAFPRLPVKSFMHDSDLPALVSGSAFTIMRYRLTGGMIRRARTWLGRSVEKR